MKKINCKIDTSNMMVNRIMEVPQELIPAAIKENIKQLNGICNIVLVHGNTTMSFDDLIGFKPLNKDEVVYTQMGRALLEEGFGDTVIILTNPEWIPQNELISINSISNGYALIDGKKVEVKNKVSIRYITADIREIDFSVVDRALYVDIVNELERPVVYSEDHFLNSEYSTKDKIIESINKNRFTYIYGNAGSGKTTIVNSYLDNQKYKSWTIIGKNTMMYPDVFGYYNVIDGRFMDTPLKSLVKNGGYLFIDEMDAMRTEILEILMFVNSGKLGFPDETVDVHPDFKIIGVGNTLKGFTEEYNGRVEIPMYVLSNFDVHKYKLDIDDIKKITGVTDEDLEMIKEICGFDKFPDRELSIRQVLMGIRIINDIVDISGNDDVEKDSTDNNEDNSTEE